MRRAGEEIAEEEEEEEDRPGGEGSILQRHLARIEDKVQSDTSNPPSPEIRRTGMFPGGQTSIAICEQPTKCFEKPTSQNLNHTPNFIYGGGFFEIFGGLFTNRD